MLYSPVPPDAVAHIKGGSECPNIAGTVRFYQKHGSVLLVARICGLPQRDGAHFFAMHIHEGGSCLGEGFPNTGGHYNPTGKPHPEHAGDLPPLMRCRSGESYLAVQTDRFCVRDVIGRTLVIHSDADDFRSQPAGNSGTKIACGMICRK